VWLRIQAELKLPVEELLQRRVGDSYSVVKIEPEDEEMADEFRPQYRLLSPLHLKPSGSTVSTTNQELYQLTRAGRQRPKRCVPRNSQGPQEAQAYIGVPKEQLLKLPKADAPPEEWDELCQARLLEERR
jgi:hypothetical protein